MGNGAVMEKPVCKDKDIGGINTELKKLGIQLQVKVDGVPVGWKSDGHIPELSEAGKVEIRLTCGKNVHGFNVALGKDRIVVGAKNYSKSSDRKVYHKTIHIEDGTRTNYPVNNIRLLRPYGDHSFKITEIGIAFQWGEGYLTVQDVYEGICYQDKDDKLVCPAFEKWPSLLDFLRQIQKQEGGFAELPLLNRKPNPTPKNKIFGGTKEGFVNFFNLNAGFGVIKTISGDAYVEYESIISTEKPLFLPKGSEVVFKHILRSTEEGTLKWKVLEVRVV